MKIQLCIVILLSVFISALSSQSKAELYLTNNVLNGACDDPYFTGFMIELDTIYSSIDSSILFGQLPRLGTINFKHKTNIPTEFTRTDRAGYPQIMFRFRSEWLTFDDPMYTNNSISFTIDRDPVVPFTEDDLKIIQLASDMLSEPKYWHKQDDRICEDDLANKSYSLFCALKIASLAVEQKYNHRNAVLQKLRHLINEKDPNKQWNHRLMDFNNQEETTYEDIISILAEMEAACGLDLKQK